MCICCLAGSRRAFLRAAVTVPLMACAGTEARGDESELPTSPVAPSPDDGVEVTPTAIRVRLDRTPDLTRDGGSLVVAQASTIVIHAGASDYRAFSNICTHAGCGISIFFTGRIRCGCHGSEFDVEGDVVSGPATIGLPRRTATVESGILVIARS